MDFRIQILEVKRSRTLALGPIFLGVGNESKKRKPTQPYIATSLSAAGELLGTEVLAQVLEVHG